MFSTLYFLLHQVEMECRREKLRHVVMVAAVVWGILPLWGLMASPPDIKGISFSYALDTIFFYKFFNLILLSTAIFRYPLSRTQKCEKNSLKYDVLKFCAIRSLGLGIRYHRIVIRYLDLQNSFPGTPIRDLELHNSFPLTAVRSHD